jgi:ribosomal protein S18 acetylase RimI-like enzyme
MPRRGSDDQKDGVFERMVGALTWTAQALADEVREVDGGLLVSTPTLAQVWSLNHIALWSVPDPIAAIALADWLQADLTFRHVQVSGAHVRLDEHEFTRAGWKVDREVHMQLVAPPQSGDSSDLVELTEDQVTRLMGQWIEEDHPGISTVSRAQIEEASRREGRLWDERAFGVVDGDGTPLAVTKLRTGRNIAWVEDVFTSAPARRRGYARRLVTHAVTSVTKGVDFTFIVADDNDWPKNLYSSLGFRPVGLTWSLHRDATR